MTPANRFVPRLRPKTLALASSATLALVLGGSAPQQASADAHAQFGRFQYVQVSSTDYTNVVAWYAGSAPTTAADYIKILSYNTYYGAYIAPVPVFTSGFFRVDLYDWTRGNFVDTYSLYYPGFAEPR